MEAPRDCILFGFAGTSSITVSVGLRARKNSAQANFAAMQKFKFFEIA